MPERPGYDQYDLIVGESGSKPYLVKLYNDGSIRYGLVCGLGLGVGFAVLNPMWRSRSVGITLLESALFAMMAGTVFFIQSWTHRRRR